MLYAPGLLGGYWGCSLVWDDNDPADPESLHVTTDLIPEEAAESALAWFADLPGAALNPTGASGCRPGPGPEAAR